MFRITPRSFLFLAFWAFAAFVVPAKAHEFILKPDSAFPAPGQKTRVQAQAAHVFMVSEEAERPESVRLQLWHNGTARDIALKEDKGLLALVGEFALPSSAPALLVGHRLPQIWCETTTGEHEGSRAMLEAKGLKVGSAGKYEKFAKTLLNPAPGDSLHSKVMGQDLEIILLTNPADIKPGSALEAQVFLHGKPLSGAGVGLTHDGFSKEEDTYKFKATTDGQGKVVFTPDRDGLWMVRAIFVEETPGGEADMHNRRATYVFPLR